MLIFHCNWQHVFQKFCSHLLQDHSRNTTYFKAVEYKAKLMLSLEICSDKVEEKIF